MIDAEKFIKALVREGYTHVCAVPCSFASSVINATINIGDKLEYVPCASEAVACSFAAGLKLAGKKPVLLAQSSGLTNMGSCITSLLKPYGIKLPIIISWRTYKQGDSEVQHAHLATHLHDLIKAYGYTVEQLSTNLEQSIEQINSTFFEEKILIFLDKTFNQVELEDQFAPVTNGYPPRSQYLSILNDFFKKGI